MTTNCSVNSFKAEHMFRSSGMMAMGLGIEDEGESKMGLCDCVLTD